jgi:hypothetical protein
MDRPVAFWLLPAEHPMRLFAECIDGLACRYDAPRFLPHVTVRVERLTPDADLAAVLEEVAARRGPFAMRTGPTGHSPMRFKALFVPLCGDEIFGLASDLAVAAAPWRRALADGGEAASGYRLEPHLSLLYKELPAGERAALAARHSYAGESVRFDRITAVTPRLGAADFSCVEDWVVSPPRVLSGINPPRPVTPPT